MTIISSPQSERVALLVEEMGESLQALGKIQRHGFNSYNPTLPTDQQTSNRQHLEKELGDVIAAIGLMAMNNDVNIESICLYAGAKFDSVQQWLHYNTVPKNVEACISYRWDD